MITLSHTHPCDGCGVRFELGEGFHAFGNPEHGTFCSETCADEAEREIGVFQCSREDWTAEPCGWKGESPGFDNDMVVCPDCGWIIATLEPQITVAPARTTDPDTSKAAASKPENLIRWGSHRARLLEAYYACADFGLTDGEAAQIAGLFPPASSSPWKRCSELRDAGLIEDTGKRRDSTFGSECMVCSVTEAGRLVYKAAWAKNQSKV